MLQEKETDPAYASKNYDNAVKQVLNKPSPIIVAHIRLDGNKSYPGINNIQPFTYKNWSMMINGRVEINESTKLLNDLNKYDKKYSLKPTGTVGDEKALYYFLGKMKDNNLNLEDPNLKVQDIQHSYAEAINDINTAIPYITQKINGKIMNITGEIETSPAFNIITSNGNILMAYANGPKLFVGAYKLNNGEKEYIISSEVIQPRQNQFNKNIEWSEIPKGHILTLYKNNKDEIVAEIKPLKKLLQEEL